MLKLALLAAVLAVSTYADEPVVQRTSIVRRHGPEYLAKLSEEDRKAYLEIVRSKTLTIQQVADQKLAFAEKHGFADEIKKELARSQENAAKILAERPKIIAALDDLNKKITEVYNNKDITIAKQEELINELGKDNKNALRTLQFIASLIVRGDARHGGKHGGRLAGQPAKHE